MALETTSALHVYNAKYIFHTEEDKKSLNKLFGDANWNEAKDEFLSH